MTEYLPEGGIINSAANKAALQNILSLQGAQQNGTILEAKAAVCTAGHDLLLDLGDIKGVIPRTEGAIGIESGETRDIAIISRVNKPVCFRARRFRAQKSYMLPPGGTGKLRFRISFQACSRRCYSGGGNAYGKLRLLCGYRLRNILSSANRQHKHFPHRPPERPFSYRAKYIRCSIRQR